MYTSQRKKKKKTRRDKQSKASKVNTFRKPPQQLIRTKLSKSTTKSN